MNTKSRSAPSAASNEQDRLEPSLEMFQADVPLSKFGRRRLSLHSRGPAAVKLLGRRHRNGLCYSRRAKPLSDDDDNDDNDDYGGYFPDVFGGTVEYNAIQYSCITIADRPL